MTTVDDLWYLSDEATQRAEQAYHRLTDQYDDFLEFETIKHVPRPRFRTVAKRIRNNGAPYGAHTLTYRTTGELLLVRHGPVDKWVLPGGETIDGETFADAARRELHEEAGIDASPSGIGLLGRVNFRTGDHATWGVLPMFETNVGDEAPEPTVNDPDGEIRQAGWFDELPEDTRDREELLRWRRERAQ